MKTKEEILADVTGWEVDELRDKVGTPIIDVDDICTAMDAYAMQQVEAATANHDKEIADFCEWVTTQHGMYPHSWQIMLNKFRQSNGV